MTSPTSITLRLYWAVTSLTVTSRCARPFSPCCPTSFFSPPWRESAIKQIDPNSCLGPAPPLRGVLHIPSVFSLLFLHPFLPVLLRMEFGSLLFPFFDPWPNSRDYPPFSGAFFFPSTLDSSPLPSTPVFIAIPPLPPSPRHFSFFRVFV